MSGQRLKERVVLVTGASRVGGNGPLAEHEHHALRLRS
jgi:hypothetical protein